MSGRGDEGVCTTTTIIPSSLPLSCLSPGSHSTQSGATIGTRTPSAPEAQPAP